MGSVTSCCKNPDKIDSNIVGKDYHFYSTNNNKRKLNNFSFRKNQTLDINNIIISEGSEFDKNNENNTENSIRSYDINKIKKIQRKFRLYYIRNKFIKEVKPSIERKTTDFINKFYNSMGWHNIEEDDFSEDGWKKYYPEDDRFFLYLKGEVFSNQIRINNIYNPEKLEIYEGEMNLENLRHGFGVLTTPYYVLKGSWRKGKFTGWGRKYLRNGDILEGKFVNGELNGKGTFKNKDSFYVGDFLNDERNGKGELTTEKYHYKGDFKNDKFNGFGVIKFLIEGHTYEGNFENNEITGKGIYKWKNGDIYEGDMKKGKMDGRGKYVYIDGKIYEGEYIEGIKEGKGKVFYPDGKSFEGNFKNGLPDGEGLYTKNGKTNKVLFSEGNFVNNLP